jgi:1,4-dihydroxy-6-naphthoate synthase
MTFETAVSIREALQASIKAAYDDPEGSIPYAMQWGRGIDNKLGEKFVKMYVNDVTYDMGERGKKALEHLFKLGGENGIIPKNIEIKLV